MHTLETADACFLPSPLSLLSPLPLLSAQIAAFRNVNATAIQRIVRGMQARALFRKVKARALVQRQMLFFLTRAFVASAKVARRIREEMRKKNVSEAGPRRRPPPPCFSVDVQRVHFVCGHCGTA